MKEDIVVPRFIAEKLKEISFTEMCAYYYLNINGEGSSIPTRTTGPVGDWNISKTRMSAPTWDQVIEWFNNKHNILIYELPTLTDRGSCFKTKDRRMVRVLGPAETSFGSTRHEALTKAIEEAILLI